MTLAVPKSSLTAGLPPTFLLQRLVFRPQSFSPVWGRPALHWNLMFTRMRSALTRCVVYPASDYLLLFHETDMDRPSAVCVNRQCQSHRHSSCTRRSAANDPRSWLAGQRTYLAFIGKLLEGQAERAIDYGSSSEYLSYSVKDYHRTWPLVYLSYLVGPCL